MSASAETHPGGDQPGQPDQPDKPPSAARRILPKLLISLA